VPSGPFGARTAPWAFEHAPATAAEARIALALEEDRTAPAAIRLLWRGQALGDDVNLAYLETAPEAPLDAVLLTAYSFSDGAQKGVLYLGPTDTVADARARLEPFFKRSIAAFTGRYAWWACLWPLRHLFAPPEVRFADADRMSKISPARIIRVTLGAPIAYFKFVHERTRFRLSLPAEVDAGHARRKAAEHLGLDPDNVRLLVRHLPIADDAALDPAAVIVVSGSQGSESSKPDSGD
jgi:hypothetical protein